ncbi:D-amino acid dehydrogenase [Burkholderia cepacia]|uniref:D-amino acid dehydrogenase n=1 Tax=Burkholderia cepacia TaxID=292 RepID=UPI00075AF41E|nr:D-amino acid dehydrogenase [Burkholderia cepacia]KVU60304.1 amino acid dehydrogenase [Burkholderia cepacia]
MKVVVLGAGLSGVLSAYYLNKDGHDVTVVDRQPIAANETSHANGSLICLGHSYPWASPAAPGILLKSLIHDDQALRLSPKLSPRMWSWLLKFLLECPRSRADRHAASRLRLAAYSQSLMASVIDDAKLQFHHTDRGLLYIYRNESTMKHGVEQMRVLEENGLPIKIINADEVAAIEPSLRPVKSEFVGAVYVPSDGTGDARLFTVELAKTLEARGVKFLYNADIRGLNVAGGRVVSVDTSRGSIAADTFVAAMGSYTPLLLRSHGIKLDIFPVKGYSMTIPIDNPDEAPVIGGLDEDNLLAFSRLGDKLRLTATAQFVGYDTSHTVDDFRHMTQAAKSLYPTIGDYANAKYWAGLRPATPDGNTRFGPAKYPNLILNTGQGSMGWTMACGSGRVTADIVAGRRPAIDISEMVFRN